MFVPNRELGNFLVDTRALARADLARLNDERGDTSLYELLRARSLVQEDELVRAAAHILGVPFTEFRHEYQPEALLLVPEPLARTHSLALVSTDSHHAQLLLTDLDDLKTVEFLERENHLLIKPHLTDRASIKRALIIHQRLLKDKYAERIKNPSLEVALDALLSHAALSRAREVYLEQVNSGVRVRYRINTALYDAMTLPVQAKSFIPMLKELAGLSLTLATPQEGRFRITLKNSETLRVGVFSLNTKSGERLTLHLSPQSGSQKGFTLESLGLHGNSLNEVLHMTNARAGLVLIAAPKEGGKTTTLYTLLDLLSRPDILAVSVEEEISLVLPHVSQVEVRKDLGMTIASTLRAALKHRPDVVMIDEIKDEDTAALAASAASYGALVIAGIRQPSASKAIQKMLSLDVPPLVLSTVLRGVLGQRVVRKLCPHCREAYTPSRAEIAPLEDYAKFARVLTALREEGVISSDTQWKEVEFYRARGCDQCDGGYQGTTGLLEVLPVSAITRELIETKDDEKRAKIKDETMLNLVEEGIFKAAEGLTTLEEVAEVIGE